MNIKKGNKISVEYEGRLENGEVFDSSSHGDHSHPLEFEVGSGQVIKGFDNAVVGMKLNEEKEIKISPEEAYGQSDSKLTQEIPRKSLPKNQDPKEDMMLNLQTQEGHKLQAKITKVTKDKITIDMNHPLAGQTLIFKIKIIDIQ